MIHLYQAVANGAVLMEYLTYPGSHLPLWSISYIKMMYQLHKLQTQWRAGLEWVNKHLQLAESSQALFEVAHYYLTTVQWNKVTEIPGSGSGTTTHEFAAYLSNVIRVNNNHINMVFTHLGECIEQDGGLPAKQGSKNGFFLFEKMIGLRQFLDKMHPSGGLRKFPDKNPVKTSR